MEANNVTDVINNEWIEESITRNHIKFYEYGQFSEIEKIGAGGFGQVSRAKWKNTEKYFALKSFFNLKLMIIFNISRNLYQSRYIL